MSLSKTTETIPAVQPYAWVVLAVVFLASVAAPLNQMKVPPIMPVLMSAFDLSLVNSGLLMSVFAITGLILALPSGVVLQRLGLKTTGLLALGALVTGSVLGAAASSYAILLASRVIEGTGMMLIAVVGPAAIAAWFPSARRGAPMGIWATWFPVGSLTMYLLAPRLASALGWQSVWWFGAGFAGLVFILFAVFMRTPAKAPGMLDTGGVRKGLSQALANPNIWLLGLAFAAYNLGLGGSNTYYPTFLSSVRGMDINLAAATASLTTMIVPFVAPTAGMLSDRIGSRRLVFTYPFLVICAMMLLPYRITGWMIPAWLIGMGLVVGVIPTAIFSAAPEVMGKPQWAGLGMAVVMLGQNLGMFAGPMIFGAVVEHAGWITAGNAMIPVLLTGFIAAWFVKVR